MKIIKVLGDERMYLMSDGSKRPFGYKQVEPVEVIPETVTIDEAVQVLESKKKRKNKKA
jgi:ethanolamine utilization protein EutQ (cupin superfamily)